MTPLLHSLRSMLTHARALDRPVIEAAIAEIERVTVERDGYEFALTEVEAANANWAKECAALREELAAAREMERLWFDRYYTLWISTHQYLPLMTRAVYADWAKEVNAYYDAALAAKEKA